jgi:hypothetical protein
MTYIQRRQPKGHSHRYFVDANTSDAVCLCGKVRGSKKAAAGKYHAIRCTYDGFTYDSKFEALMAMELDWRLKGKDIQAWERQFVIEIRNPKTGELLRRHKVDFRITHNDGSYELVEAKGFETRDWKMLRDEIEVLWLPEHENYRYTVANARLSAVVISDKLERTPRRESSSENGSS